MSLFNKETFTVDEVKAERIGVLIACSSEYRRVNNFSAAHVKSQFNPSPPVMSEPIPSLHVLYRAYCRFVLGENNDVHGDFYFWVRVDRGEVKGIVKAKLMTLSKESVEFEFLGSVFYFSKEQFVGNVYYYLDQVNGSLDAKPEEYPVKQKPDPVDALHPFVGDEPKHISFNDLVEGRVYYIPVLPLRYMKKTINNGGHCREFHNLSTGQYVYIEAKDNVLFYEDLLAALRVSQKDVDADDLLKGED